MQAKQHRSGGEFLAPGEGRGQQLGGSGGLLGSAGVESTEGFYMRSASIGLLNRQDLRGDESLRPARHGAGQERVCGGQGLWWLWDAREGMMLRRTATRTERSASSS